MSLLDKSASKAQLIDILNSMKLPIMGAGGGFAPIGTEAYFDGNTAPLGWVICDGTELNIADYPDLATYYASQHGASNCYGGNGTTTFATPKRSGMPNSGVDTPDEHIVGEWRETVDGVLKYKPVYEKVHNIENTITWPSNLSSYPDQTFLSNLNIENLIESEAFGHCASSTGIVKDPLEIAYDGGAWKWRFYESWGNMISTHIKLQYTKSTDTWTTVQEGHSSDGNGVFCIKATVSGDPNAHQYSTDEQVVGTWIDGSNEYQKVIDVDGSNVLSHAWTTLADVSALNVAQITNFVCLQTSDGSIRNVPTMKVSSGNLQCYCDYTNASIGFSKVILNYTKTSA